MWVYSTNHIHANITYFTDILLVEVRCVNTQNQFENACFINDKLKTNIAWVYGDVATTTYEFL